MPGDSTVVPDRQNPRMLVITPDAEPGGFLSPRGATGEGISGYPSLRRSASGIMLHPATASDERGFFYCFAQPIVVSPDGELRLADSMAIERWTAISAKRDTIGFLPITQPPDARITMGMTSTPASGRHKAFRASNEWAIAADGWLAIVHVDPYHVKFVDATGNVRIGPPIPYEPIKVTKAHKQQWLDAKGEAQMLVRTSDGREGMVRTTRNPDEPEWPKYLPPFMYTDRYTWYFQQAAHFASDGMLWVRRTTPVGEPPTFDIIDRTGRVVQQLQLPHNGRLVGFGDRSVWRSTSCQERAACSSP